MLVASVDGLVERLIVVRWYLVLHARYLICVLGGIRYVFNAYDYYRE